MRTIDPVIKSRLLQMQQTLFNNAQPSMDVQALRPRTAIFHPRFWQETIVTGGITATCTSIAVRKTSAIADRVFVAYVSSNSLTVKSSALTYPISNMAWTQELSIPNCSGCALEFDGNFVRVPHSKVEFRTESTPWLFYTTTTGNQLMGGVLGGEYEPIAGNVIAFDSIRGVANMYKDIDQGLIVFYIVSGAVYYRQCISGLWEEQQTIGLAPVGAVLIKAERTFDWRIVLQITDNSGALHEVFTKMAISSNINYELLTAWTDIRLSVVEIQYTDYQANEHITASADMSIHMYWGLAPVVVSIENQANVDKDYGFLVRIVFDCDVFSIAGNEAAFQLVDGTSNVYDCTAIVQDTPCSIILTFEDFNSCTNPLTFSYIAGTVSAEVEQLMSFSQNFTATGLVPVITDPPIPLGIINIKEWSVT